jgi:hypothetical protein
MAIGQLDWSSIVKLQLLYNFVISALYGMGTERHFKEIQRLMRREVTSFNSWIEKREIMILNKHN